MQSRRQSLLDQAAGIEVPALGTTWLRRGPAYWLRRVGIVALLFAPLSLASAFLVAILHGIGEHSRAGFIVGVVVAVAVIGLIGWVSWGSGPTRTIGRDMKQLEVLNTVVPATIVVILVLAFINKRAALIVLLSAFTIAAVLMIGPFLVLLIRMLGRELPAERETRIRYRIPPPGSDDEVPVKPNRRAARAARRK